MGGVLLLTSRRWSRSLLLPSSSTWLPPCSSSAVTPPRMELAPAREARSVMEYTTWSITSVVSIYNIYSNIYNIYNNI